MTLPGDRLPDEVYPAPSSTPAQHADVLPVYCRHGARWDWDGGKGGYRCAADGHYVDQDDDDEAAEAALPTMPGALPVECQPTYAHDPRTNPKIWAALHAEDIERRTAQIVERARDRGMGL